jgi:hypothetical protein
VKTLRILTIITFIAVLTPLGAAIEPGAPTTATQNPYVRLSQEEKDNQLIQEVSAGNIDNVRLLIEANANVNYIDILDRDALGTAFKNGNSAIVEILLKAHADDNSDEGLTVNENNKDLVKIMLENHTVNLTTLCRIAEWIKEHPQPDIETILHEKCSVPTEQDELLRKAGLAKNLDGIKAAFVAGANPNACGFKSNRSGTETTCIQKSAIAIPFIQYAVEEGRTDMVQAFLAAGANPNAAERQIVKITEQRSHSKYTYKSVITTPILVTAIRNGDVEMVRMLIAAGASVNRYSTSRQDETETKILSKEIGVDTAPTIYVVTENKRSPLMWAMSFMRSRDSVSEPITIETKNEIINLLEAAGAQ